MDTIIDGPRPNNSCLDTILIDRLIRPLSIITLCNYIIVLAAVDAVSEVAARAFQGDFGYTDVLSALLFAFPGWIAWKNANGVKSLSQKYTILSLLSFGLSAVLLGLGTAQSLTSVPDHMHNLHHIFVVDHFNIIRLAEGSLAIVAALAVWRLRHRVVAPLGIKLVDLLSAISRTSARPRNVKPRRPVLGCMLILAAPGMITLDNFMPVEAQLRDPGKVMFFGFFLLLLARSAFQPSATALLKEDVRRPVLLLRSFTDDEKIRFFSTRQSSFVDPSLESRLTGHFGYYGPFIAVGAPSEAMPIIGAARVRLTNAEWQDQVLHWIKDSIVILMMAGTTTWVDWELKQVIAHDGIGKLIVCFPPLRRKWKSIRWRRNFSMDMEARLSRVRHSFAATPWATALDQLDDARSLRSVVLRPDGRVAVIRARTFSREGYHLAVLVGHWIMNTDSLAAAARAEAAPPVVEVTSRPKIEHAASGMVPPEVVIPMEKHRDRRRLRLYPIDRKQARTVGRSPVLWTLAGAVTLAVVWIVSELPRPATTIVALLIPLGSDHADIAQVLLAGAQLALDHWDPASLLVEDTQGSPNGAAAAAEAAISFGAKVLLGPLTREETTAVAQVANASSIPVLSFSNSSDQARADVWPLGITIEQQVLRLVVAVNAAGRSKVAALLPLGDFGRAAADALIAAAESGNLPPPEIRMHGPGLASIIEVARSLAEYAHCGLTPPQLSVNAEKQAESVGNRHTGTFEALFLGDTGNELDAVTQVLLDAGVQPPCVQIIGPAMWASPLSGAYKLQGAWYAAPDPAARANFVQSYAAKYGSPPPLISDLAYDAASITRVLGPRAFSIGGLTQPNGFVGADGWFALLPNGRVRRALAVFAIQRDGPRMVEPAPQSGNEMIQRSSLPERLAIAAPLDGTCPVVSIGINGCLWHAAIDILSFIPLASVNPSDGVIITDWYTPATISGERFKTIAHIVGPKLRSEGIHVEIFRDVLQNGQWISAPVSSVTVGEITQKIVERAHELSEMPQSKGKSP